MLLVYSKTTYSLSKVNFVLAKSTNFIGLSGVWISIEIIKWNKDRIIENNLDIFVLFKNNKFK